MPFRPSLRLLAAVPTVVALAACAGDSPTALRSAGAPSFQGGDGGSTTAAPAVANVNGYWTALVVDSTDSQYNQRITLRIDQRGTALSGQYESVYLCCPESNNKYKFTGSIDAAGRVSLAINAGAGDRTSYFGGTVSADRTTIVGGFTTAGGTGSGITFTR